ncbi:DUF4159 domain-containing protein [Planctomicrobium sp. SH661]|uniref:DUF4159 domain-containing protein n=1 Tax=Planctomicrobium sp. SH661 TaxID=3448124 RepID=UPI003F5BFC0D
MRGGFLLVLVLGAVTLSAYAQLQRRSRDGSIQQIFQTQEPTRFLIDRRGVPEWEVDPAFPSDLFTFVRIMYNPVNGMYGAWNTDYPDSDLNFSFRLQQLTSLKVSPNPIVLELTDHALFDYPFIYFCEPGGGFNRNGGLNFSDEEVQSLQKYLRNGGFAMFDDFWGEAEWENFAREMKKVFPNQEPQELPLDHPIFHIVYDLQEKPQVPSIEFGRRGISYERPDATEVHYRGFFDDAGRLVALACHNTDLGDGWEREGEDVNYFHEYSEKKAYPMGINIVFYAMTH